MGRPTEKATQLLQRGLYSCRRRSPWGHAIMCRAGAEDSMKDILLEICCGSIDDAIQSENGGADRVELCSALFLGGLTPSIGTIQETKRRLTIPVMAMVRPRGGGFCYTAAEFATMERDAEAAIHSGAEGIVFGILKEDGRIDQRRTQRMRRIIGKRQAVFHRAFDVTPDPFKALDQLIDSRHHARPHQRTKRQRARRRGIDRKTGGTRWEADRNSSRRRHPSAQHA